MPFFEPGELPPGDRILLKIEDVVRYLLSTRNTWTAVILLFVAVFIIYPWLQTRDPDTHPLLLFRQATPSSVRQPGESAVYRSQDVPHGFPLTSGLNVRDTDTPIWARGRNGDLRDVWRKAVKGESDGNESTKKETSAIFTVLGKEDILEHDLGEFVARKVESRAAFSASKHTDGMKDGVTKEINIMGNYFCQRGANRVATYLPNSLPLLTTLFGK